MQQIKLPNASSIYTQHILLRRNDSGINGKRFYVLSLFIFFSSEEKVLVLYIVEHIQEIRVSHIYAGILFEKFMEILAKK